MRLSEATEEYIFKKLETALEDLARIDQEIGGKADIRVVVAMNQAVQSSLQTMALLRISKNLDIMNTNLRAIKGVFK